LLRHNDIRREPLFREGVSRFGLGRPLLVEEVDEVDEQLCRFAHLSRSATISHRFSRRAAPVTFEGAILL
jgi:hypothetical protein